MDTDCLTEMAYDCILIADKATDVLTSELGAMCSFYKSENEYLQSILAYVKKIEENPEDYLDYWNLVDEMDIPSFRKNIRFLRKQIESTIKTPVSERYESAV